jgi:hypothetical protein
VAVGIVQCGYGLKACNPRIRISMPLLKAEVCVIEIGAIKLPDTDGRVIRPVCRMKC